MDQVVSIMDQVVVRSGYVDRILRVGPRDGIYSFSSDLILALGLVTRMASCWARSTRFFLFLDETPWAISAQNFLFCIMRTSNSLMLWTRTFLKPDGIMCLVALADP